MKLFWRGLLVFLSICLGWESVVQIFHLPNYILPSPIEVFITGYQQFGLIMDEARFTMIETLSGLMLGTLLGCSVAMLMMFFRPVSYWLMPILIVSQAIPTFSIAPLIVIWFGYGMASKIVTTVIMLFFPVTSAFYDGLRNTPQGWIDLAKTMQSKRWRFFWYIRMPAALPYFASGLRVAAVFAPIGAVVGEWVGASKGLGFLMLNANARMQIDLMFAGLFVLVIFALALYFVIDMILRRWIFWKI